MVNTNCLFYSILDCLNIRPVPNELTLNLDLKVDDETFYSGKIGKYLYYK